MLLKLPIMLLSIAPKFPLLCSKYAHIKDCSIRVPNASVNVLLGYFIMR